MTIVEQNHNPLNIRYNRNNNWTGKIIGKNNGFESFGNDVYAFRAGIIILRGYYFKHNLHTISGFIKRYAPSSENDTENYIKFVSEFTKIPSDRRLAWNKETICSIIQAMAKMESGKLYSRNIIELAWEIV